MATVTTRSEPSSAPTALAVEPVPPLENGDRLTRPEFERRYDAMPHLKKAELIEGIVYIMASPVGHQYHGIPHFQAITWLGLYKFRTPLVQGGDNSSIRLDLDNMPQPDTFLYLRPQYGGTVRFSEKGDLVEGAPDLIFEVASSSVSYDLHAKLNAYRRNGVKEYIVWRTRDRTIDWFVLRDGQYEQLPLLTDGLYRSTVFPGLWLAPEALVKEDDLTLAAALERGLQSPEHAAFLARLQPK